jgi:acetyl esterase/lipase
MNAAGRAPVLILLLHGGFWRAAYDRTHLGPLASALAAESFAVCTPEFRRTGRPGGGWPGTFDDVALAVDRLPGLVQAVLPGGAAVGGAAAGGVILAGHSAGGHLALWSAGRHRLGPDCPWHLDPGAGGAAGASGASGAGGGSGAGMAGVAGVVALAPISDLAACYQAGLDHDAVGDLLGGGPAEQPARYAAADPAQLIPLGVPVRIVHGTADDRVPFAMSQSFAARDRAAGDPVQLDLLEGGGHFAVIDPLSAAWPVVLAAFRAIAT